MQPVQTTNPFVLSLREAFDYSEGAKGLCWKGNRNAAGCLVAAGYVQIRFKQKLYYAHRLVWLYFYGEDSPKMLDHINRNRADNRIENLRICDNSQNAYNSKKSAANTSGYRGVTWDAAKQLWAASIWNNNKRISLGRYPTAELAHQAFEAKSKELMGEFICAPN